ncbi:MAG: STAS domain-containing protein [Sciscionella sp.]
MARLDIEVGDTAVGVTTTRVAGELDMHSAPELRAKLGAVIAARPGGNVRLDLRALDFADSSGLSALIAMHKLAEASEGRLVLINPPRSVRRMLAITGLDTVLTVSEDSDPPAASEGAK